MDNTIKDEKKDLHPTMSHSNDAFIDYFVKKTEKISGAIYIITNFIPKTEPIRRRIQKNVLKLLSHTFTIKKTSKTGDGVSQSVFSLTSQVIPELISLLSIAHASGYVTEMNSSIIIAELRRVSGILTDSFGVVKNLSVSKDDLHVPDHGNERIESSSNKGHNKSAIKDTSISVKDTTRSPKTEGKKTIAKKSERRDAILSLLKEYSEISVKDVAETLPHYSEKTLQRELIKMADEGIIDKEGERRWTRYSLKREI